jgi:WD40 repeat protein
VTSGHARGHRELRQDRAVGRGDRPALTRLLEHQHSVVSAAVSPDGTRVVTASDDNTGPVWYLRIDTGMLEQ